MFSATDYDKLQQIMEEAPWKKELLTRLLESHRMEVSAISHEIRNPFTLIYSTLQMIEGEWSLGQEAEVTASRAFPRRFRSTWRSFTPSTVTGGSSGEISERNSMSVSTREEAKDRARVLRNVLVSIGASFRWSPLL